MSAFNSRFNVIVLSLKGMAMGIAEVIPGVSGGTIALITGIYDELIKTIKSSTGIFIKPKDLFSFKILWDKFNGPFLIPLLLGMTIGVVTGIFGVTYLLENFPEPLWSFFFGITLASIIYLLGQEKIVGFKYIFLFLLGIIVAMGIVRLTPAHGTENLIIIFFAGMIAISATVLPGISGSFMLLLMGLYNIIIPSLKGVLSFDFSKLSIVIIFALGCLLGLTLFSRILSYLLAKHRKGIMAVLIGFMAGSLYKLWPWRNTTLAMNKETHQIFEINQSSIAHLDMNTIRILKEDSVIPSNYWGEPFILVCIIAFYIGILCIYLFSKINNSVKTNS